MTAPRPLAVVTGASSGIGDAYARRLASDGYDLIVAARRVDRLDALAATLASTHGTTTDVVGADLSTHDGIDTLVAAVTGRDVAFCVNNAGRGGYAPFAELDPSDAEALVHLHVLAPTRLTRSVLPGMLAAGRGSVVNVASLLAFSASLPPGQLPERSVYAGAKSYLVAFTRTLAHEVTGSGVQVQVCCPGLVATEFHARPIPMPMLGPDDIVTASLRGLEIGEVVCAPPVADPDAVEALAAAELAFLAGGTVAELAPRYRD